MTTNRRTFLGTSFAGLALAVTGGCVSPAASCIEAEITRKKFALLRQLPTVMPRAYVKKSVLTGKNACKYVDDCIWFLRDLARTRPAHAFDHPFLAGFKRLHERYGLKVQCNLFYRTDFFYGMDEFTLAQVPADYKKEFLANADWLKFGFHALQEFPDYPWINANYDDVAKCLRMIRNEVTRFAGEEMFAHALVPHWVPMSKDGIRALADNGIKIVYATYGARWEYGNDPNVLPYGHSLRLTNNRKPETALYTRGDYMAALAVSLCGYNHVMTDLYDQTHFTNTYVFDPDTRMAFRDFCTRPMSCINLFTLEQLRMRLEAVKDADFVGYGNHEQYFFKDYLAYQPEYMVKEEFCAKTLAERGYRYVFMEDLVK